MDIQWKSICTRSVPDLIRIRLRKMSYNVPSQLLKIKTLVQPRARLCALQLASDDMNASLCTSFVPAMDVS